MTLRWRGRHDADSAATGPSDGDLATWDAATGDWIPVALNANLAAIAALATAAFGRSLLTAANAAAARALLGAAVGATGARPSAATAGAGAQFYDSTLGIPIWSTGSAWHDAAGNAV